MDAMIEHLKLCGAGLRHLAFRRVTPAIAVNALVMFALGIHVHLKLRKKGFQSVPENTWTLD